MSARRDEQTGVGCFGAILILGAIGWVLQYWLQILVTIVAIAVVSGVIWGLVAWAAAAAAALAQRRACPVCTSWSGSVVLTDLPEPDQALLCDAHRARMLRIGSLEREVLPPA